MRILYHHRTLGDGAEGIHIDEMVNAFEELGHEVRLIGPAVGRKDAGQVEKESKFELVKKIVRGPAYELSELAYNLYGYASLQKAVKDFRPHIIYDRYITFNYSAVAVGRRNNIPTFLELNAPLAYERHHEDDEKLYFKKTAYALERRISSDAFQTIVVSTPLKEYLLSIGVPGEKIMVLPNGANFNKFHSIQKDHNLLNNLGFSSRNKVIGFTGILRPWHGIDLLLKAFRKVHELFPQTVLLLVGDGPIKKDIETQAETLGCREALIITGRVPHHMVREYISLFDIAVSPKTTFYASPMKILEYMAMSKPVLAPDTVNIQDIIEDKKSGLLFVPGDCDSLVQSLSVLIKNESFRRQVAENALNEVKWHRNWQNNAREIINCYFNQFESSKR